MFFLFDFLLYISETLAEERQGKIVGGQIPRDRKPRAPD